MSSFHTCTTFLSRSSKSFAHALQAVGELNPLRFSWKLGAEADWVVWLVG